MYETWSTLLLAVSHNFQVKIKTLIPYILTVITCWSAKLVNNPKFPHIQAFEKEEDKLLWPSKWSVNSVHLIYFTSIVRIVFRSKIICNHYVINLTSDDAMSFIIKQWYVNTAGKLMNYNPGFHVDHTQAQWTVCILYLPSHYCGLTSSHLAESDCSQTLILSHQWAFTHRL